MEHSGTRITIRMNRSFTAFDQIQKDIFITDLAQLLNCDVSDFADAMYFNSCVLAKITVPEPLAELLQDLFSKKNEKGKELDPEYLLMRILSHKHAIVSINGNYDLRLNLVSSRKVDMRKRPKLLFIHGWRGDNASFENLPSYMADSLNCETLIYDYPTGILDHSPAIIHIVNHFDAWLRNKLGDEPIAVFAHSMGGVILRKYLVNQFLHEHRLESLFKLITLIASPHNGASLATMAALIPGIRSMQLEEISHGSSYLFELDSYWKNWVADAGSDKMIKSIYGTQDKVVEMIDAVGLDRTPIAALGRDHRNIIKPTDNEDFIVQTLIRLTLEAFPGAPFSKKRRKLLHGSV